MSDRPPDRVEDGGAAPGDEPIDQRRLVRGVGSYLTGFGVAALLTIVSFTLAGTGLVWGPAVGVALVVLAIAQMGVHLVFFLHITTGADNTNNVIALAFGVLVVMLLIFGSVWIMGHLSHQAMDMANMTQRMH